MARTVSIAKRGQKISKASKSQKAKEKLVQLLKSNKLTLVGLPLQCIQLLEYYMKNHIHDGEPVMLREVLRLAHKLLPLSPAKSKLRGILGKISIQIKNYNIH